MFVLVRKKYENDNIYEIMIIKRSNKDLSHCKAIKITYSKSIITMAIRENKFDYYFFFDLEVFFFNAKMVYSVYRLFSKSYDF